MHLKFIYFKTGASISSKTNNNNYYYRWWLGWRLGQKIHRRNPQLSLPSPEAIKTTFPREVSRVQS